MNIPTFVCSGVTTATTYHFNVGPNDIGWAFCTINDTTGELNIQSDWGSWAYGWSPKPTHLGAPTLTAFIATRNANHYIADKLWSAGGGSSYGGMEFSAPATVKAMRTELAKNRLAQGRSHRNHSDFMWKRAPWWPVGEGAPLTSDVARDLWNALDDLNNRHLSEDIFAERFYQLEGHEWIAENMTDHLAYEESGKYRVLRDGIVPALIAACRARIAPPSQAPTLQEAGTQ